MGLEKRALLCFEYDIVAHCNLNCASCSHFSPISKEEFVLSEKAERELCRIGEIAGGKCDYLNILGGEPLLNPELIEILKISRRYFPEGSIRLITNGILLTSQPDEFWHICHDNRIEIYLSEYPIKLQMNVIKAYATVFDVNLVLYENQGIFTKYSLDPAGSTDLEYAFSNCTMGNECPQYHDGKLYPCTIAGCIYRLNERFNCNFEVSENDYIDIFSDVTLDDILAFISGPIPFCRHCDPAAWKENNQFKWHLSTCKPDEWMIVKE